MSRKPPSDVFTRFTSTAPPSASSSTNTSFNSSQTQTQFTNQQPANSQPPSSETPAQRVARLRAAHRLNTAANQLSPVDKLISRGRTVADFAHRATTYSLLAITGVSTVIAVYGLVSLVSHNRRQKRAWIEREMDRLADAQKAFLRGEANAEQLHLLEQERAGEELARKFVEDKKRRKEEGTWARIRGTFGSFVGQGDKGIDTGAIERRQEVKDLSQLVEASGSAREKLLEQGWVEGEVRNVAVQSGPVDGVGLDSKGRPVPINKIERVRRTSEKEVEARTGIRGGPLDALADNAIEKVAGTGQSWWSWVSGGGKPEPSS